jgi:hypothetical protein
MVLWLVLVATLQIADVWDETNGLLLFGGPSGLAAKLAVALTEPPGFWRPLPTAVVALVVHIAPSPELAWRLLRLLTVAMLLGAAHLLGVASSARGPLRLAVTVAVLFSGSALIAASWFAAIFDASVLLLLAGALALLLRGRAEAAGITIGVAFFCKEVAALGVLMIGALLVAGRVTRRQAVTSAIPAVALGVLYFVLRATRIDLSGPGDIHDFDFAQIVPTTIGLAESFWWQTLKRSEPGVLGAAVFTGSLVALRRPRLIAAAVMLFAGAVVVYLGMFGVYQDHLVVHHLNFAGRLYLVPAALLLTLLALERRTLAIAVLIVPIVAGAVDTWRDHVRFQRLYQQIYAAAARHPEKPLRVRYPDKPLDDGGRGVLVGDVADADVVIEEATATLRWLR